MRFVAADHQKVADDLAKFAKANEKQLYKVIRTLLDQQLDLKQQLKLWVRTLPCRAVPEPG